MEYDLTHGSSDNAILQQALKNGEELPDFIKNKPDLIDDSLQFYLQAFFVLESERPVGFGVAPIPITKMIEYAKFLRYKSYEETHDFVEIVRILDMTVINHYAKKDGKKK